MSNFSLIKLRNIFTFVLHGGGECIIVNREESKSQMDSLDHFEPTSRKVHLKIPFVVENCSPFEADALTMLRKLLQNICVQANVLDCLLEADLILWCDISSKNP